MLGESVKVWLAGNWYGMEEGTIVTDDWLWACDEWSCRDEALPAEPTMVWLEGNWYGMPPGEVVTEDWLWACDDWTCFEQAPETGGWSEEPIAVYAAAQNFSVLRTGTGDLDLIAARDVSMQSIYGFYTAGTSTGSRAGDQAAGFDRARAKEIGRAHV